MNEYMELALLEAKKAQEIDEVPIGCVIVYQDEIIAKGHNTREHDQHVFSHAEINAIKEASDKLGSWRLEECDIYITLEPCIMCAGAITQARFRNVIFGASDPKGGAYGSNVDLLETPGLNHYPKVTKGVMQEECSLLIKEYFKSKRKK